MRDVICRRCVRLAKEKCEIVKGMNYSSTVMGEIKSIGDVPQFRKQNEQVKEELFLEEEYILENQLFMIGRNGL